MPGGSKWEVTSQNPFHVCVWGGRQKSICRLHAWLVYFRLKKHVRTLQDQNFSSKKITPSVFEKKNSLIEQINKYFKSLNYGFLTSLPESWVFFNLNYKMSCFTEKAHNSRGCKFSPFAQMKIWSQVCKLLVLQCSVANLVSFQTTLTTFFQKMTSTKSIGFFHFLETFGDVGSCDQLYTQ